MLGEKENQDIKSKHGFCPFLGLKEDRATISAYPSHWNVCYHVSPKCTPDLVHQRSFCLSHNYQDCIVFKQSDNIKMPKKLMSSELGRCKKNKLSKILIVLVLLSVIGISTFFMRNLWLPIIAPQEIVVSDGSQQITFPGGYKTSTKVLVLGAENFNQQPTQTEAIKPTITPSPIVQTPTATKTNPPLALETPIGLLYQFVIHRVVEGESLLLFANWYDTSAEAIQAVNLNLTYPIQIGTLVIIPVEILDVTDLPAFEAYEVTQDISVEDLAIKLGVAVEDLILYNNLESGTLLRSGDWIIVPRERS